MKLRNALSLLALGLTMSGISQAAIIVTPPTSSTAGSFTITEDITFTVVNSYGLNGFFIILDDFAATSDGTQTFVSITDSVPYSVNGTPFSSTGYFVDNLDQSIGSVTPNDSYFYVDTSTFYQAGDVVVVESGTYAIAPTTDFNSLVSGTFSGTAIAVDNGGNVLTNVTSVPEASSSLMALAGVAFMGIRRRK
jgi:hypothetical protein